MMKQLKDLICHYIIESIEANVSAGNISRSDGRKLKQITLQLYRHIYEKYEEMEKAGVNQIVEEALVLDIDIIEAEHKKEVDRLNAEHREKDKVIEQLTRKLQGLGISEEEILAMTRTASEK